MESEDYPRTHPFAAISFLHLASRQPPAGPTDNSDHQRVHDPDFFDAYSQPTTVGSLSSFLSVTPSTATTPATLTVTPNTDGLAPGRYGGLISLRSDSATGNALSTPI